MAGQEVALIGLVGVLVGYLFRLLEGWFQDRLASRRERAQRRHEFQRVTLLELQESMADLARVCGEIRHFDAMAMKRVGTRTLLPEGLSDKDFTTRRRMGMLRERVLDDPLRELVEEFNKATVDTEIFSSNTTEAELDQRMLRMGKAFDIANARLGEVLRKLY